MATHTAQGRAQTFIAASGGRLKDLTLFFESKGPAGNVVAVICETDGGYPDTANSIVEVTITPADIVVGPAGTKIPLPPESLVAGGRYGLAVLSAGDHALYTSTKPRSTTQGQHWALNGSRNYIKGDQDAYDIAFRLTYQTYEQPQCIVDLGAITFAGGMDGVVIDGVVDEPSGTDIYFEIQKAGGQWQTIGITGGQRLQADFTDRPDSIQFRAVFNGTSEKMPSLVVGGARTAIKPFRNESTFKHASNEIDAGAGEAVSYVKLNAVLDFFDTDDDDYSFDMQLDVGGSIINPASVKDVHLRDSTLVSRTAIFELGTPTQTYAAVLTGAMATGRLERFTVDNVKHYAKA